MANFCAGGLIFFYIVKQGKNIFLYIKKVWQAHFFTLFSRREHIFSQLHLILYLFGIVFGVSYNYGPKLKVYYEPLIFLFCLNRLVYEARYGFMPKNIWFGIK